MTRIFIKFYYLVLATVVLAIANRFFSTQYLYPKYIWTLSLLPNTISPYLVGLLLFSTTLLVSLTNVFYSNRYLRTFCFILFTSILALKYSFGKISHNYHIWIFSSLFMIFMDPSQKFNSYRNHLSLRLTQTILLLQYFSAGLWKIRVNKQIGSFSGLKETALEHFTYAYIENNWPMNPLWKYLIEEGTTIIAIGLASVILFQIFCGITAFFGRGYILCGVLAIAFHFTTGIFLGIWFWGTSIGAMFFLLFAELLKNQDRTDGFL